MRKLYIFLRTHYFNGDSISSSKIDYIKEVNSLFNYNEINGLITGFNDVVGKLKNTNYPSIILIVEVLNLIKKDTAEKEVVYVNKSVDVVVIEEVQFFDKEIVNICEELANNKKRVIVAGLDTDFKGDPFEVMASLLARAEFITKLSAVCTVCGAPATRTQRLIEGKPARREDPIILVGASECYEARCRKCHKII